MCGIAGVYGNADQSLEARLRRMTHRGPDGTHITSVRGHMLGHTRLAIIDVAGGDQPMSTPDGAAWLACNGEVYNHQAIRDQFPGYDFQTDADVEVILPLYEQYGVDAVNHLQGMFAFALVDRDDRLYMARDPLGIKPLYYGFDTDGGLHFASELKALIDRVEDVKTFPPGHWYTPETGLVRYYDLHTAVNAYTGPTPTLDDIRAGLRRAVHKRLMSDVPLGVYLSGGLDSTIITALVAEEIDELHSFAVGIDGSPDIVHAREAAELLGTIHHEALYTEADMVAALSEVIYLGEMFDPMLVRSAVPNYFLSRVASQYVKVVLTGEGADELYAGYNFLKQYGTGDALTEKLTTLTGQLHNVNLQRCDRMTMAHSLEGRVPFLDTEFVEMSFAVPNTLKLYGDDMVEKWGLRKAFEDIVPQRIAWRVKQQFSQGAGSSHIFEDIAERDISDAQFADEVAAVQQATGYRIDSKEELLYHREFVNHFGMDATSIMRPYEGSGTQYGGYIPPAQHTQ